MPLLQALRDLGGSATPVEARKKIIENEHLSDDVINETRGKTKVNKFENEVAFARNYLVGAGYIDKGVRGVWTLTEAGKSVELTAEMASDIFKKGSLMQRVRKRMIVMLLQIVMSILFITGFMLRDKTLINGKSVIRTVICCWAGARLEILEYSVLKMK